MGPPPIDPTIIQPQVNTGGNTGGYPAGGNGGGGYTGGGVGRMAFNPTGGMSRAIIGGGPGPTYRGGGPGWMPPPPIGPPGIGVYPTDSGGGNPTPVYTSRPVGWAPRRMPPPIPGWAGYLQWLQMMGGRMPPPPIGGI